MAGALRILAASEVAAEAGVGEREGLGVAALLGRLLALERGQLVGDAGERYLPAGGVASSLVEAAADDEAAPALALADPHLLHLQVGADIPVAAGAGERRQTGAPGQSFSPTMKWPPAPCR